jgi:hypothetical protein
VGRGRWPPVFVSRATALALLASTSLTACGEGVAPPLFDSGSSTSVPGVPDADIEFRPLLETYPSAWEALGLEPISTPADMWQPPLDDGSVLAVESRDGGGARVITVAPGGAASPLTDWLPTDRGQVWGAVAYSDPWLVYADDAGSHTDGPATAEGVFLGNTETGKITVLEVREYAAPREPCEECGDWLFFSEARLSATRIYRIERRPLGTIWDAIVTSQPLGGGDPTTLLTGDYHFDDPSCVTSAAAEVRLSGFPPGIGVSTDTPVTVWDLAGSREPVLVSPAGGMPGGANNVEPSTCAGVDVVGWWTRLNGEPLGDSIGKASEDDPNVLLSAIDFVGPGGRARLRFDDDFASFGVTSRIDGWAVIEYQATGSADQHFLLFDVQGWRLYEVDAPAGLSLARVVVSDGRLLAYVGSEPSGGGWFPADTLLSAALP